MSRSTLGGLVLSALLAAFFVLHMAGIIPMGTH